MTLQAGILGASGTTAGELLRYLSTHPEVELTWVSSRSLTGRPVTQAHPHLSGSEPLTFSDPSEIPELDVLFTATPHGTTGERMPELLEGAGTVIDLSSDFRLASPETYEATYGQAHPNPELLASAAYGLPELERERIAKSTLIAGPGCLATASILALTPLARAGLVGEGPVVLDGKIGSTAGGTGGGRWGSHAARSGTVRPYAPVGHRHEAEIQQACFPGGEQPLWFSAHATDMTRGILMTTHVPLAAPTDRRTLHRILLEAYQGEPFVDVLPGRPGPGGVPEPRFVAGTNRAQLAAMPRKDGQGAVVLCAIDNLGKGAAGSAIQSMNIRHGLDETAGLDQAAAFP